MTVARLPSDANLDYIADYNTRAKPFNWTYDARNDHAARKEQPHHFFARILGRR